MQAIFETAFDIIYLSTTIILGILMLRLPNGGRESKLAGLMSITLGAGDSFHLIPRAYALCTDGLANHTAALGTGKFITSITMTLFYLLLFAIFKERYHKKPSPLVTLLVYGSAIARIILCLFPQNNWQGAVEPMFWKIARNIPFLLLGIVIIVIFYQEARAKKDNTYRFMWLTIVLSFGFYIPVVLFAETYPAVGSLMVPKTLAYVWTIVIAYKGVQKRGRLQ